MGAKRIVPTAIAIESLRTIETWSELRLLQRAFMLLREGIQQARAAKQGYTPSRFKYAGGILYAGVLR